MKENRLGILLETFEDEDWKAYHKFAKSRYADDSDAKAIIDHIKKHKSRLDPKKLDSESLRLKIRPQAKPIVFANVVSKLCKHIEAYFVYAEVKNDPMLEDTLLLQAFANRGLTDQFHKQKKKAKDNRERQPLGLSKNYHEFMAEYLDYYKRMTTGARKTKPILKECDINISKFNKDIKDYLGVEMHNRERLLHEAWNSNQTKESNFEPIFNSIKELITKRSWDLYFGLKTILQRENYSIEIQFTIITHLTSFLKWGLLHNDEKVNSELVLLYTYGLEKGFLFPNKKISLSSFSTIINVGSKTDNFNWAEEFIEKYAHQVSDKNADQIKIFGHTYLAFTKGEHLKVIELLRIKKMNTPELEIKSRWFLLISYYEINSQEKDILRSYLSSFQSYIKRNGHDITMVAAKTHLKNLKYFNILLSEKGIKELETEIINEKQVIQKKWFLKKTKELLVKTSSPN